MDRLSNDVIASAARQSPAAASDIPRGREHGDHDDREQREADTAVLKRASGVMWMKAWGERIMAADGRTNTRNLVIGPNGSW